MKVRGSEKIDFIALLGHLPITSKILGYVPTSDLCTVAKVSKTWKKLCLQDKSSSVRLKKFMADSKNLKENLSILGPVSISLLSIVIVILKLRGQLMFGSSSNVLINDVI